MALLKVLPGFQCAAPGLERVVLRRLPGITIVCTALLLSIALGGSMLLDGGPAGERLFSTVKIAVASLLVLHWTAVFTIALVCVIVVIAKGPAYVADAYPLVDAERPSPDFSTTRSSS